jgi:hypothetical protein
MREWCLVIDAVSSKAAKQIGDALGDQNLDLEVDANHARVWCFAQSEDAIRGICGEIREALLRASLWEQAIQSGRLREWSERHHRYVNPEHPDEDPDSGEVWIDSDLDLDEIRWRVRLQLASVFEFRRVRRQLPVLHRPVIGTGNKHIDLGARDAGDAEEVARAAGSIDGVSSVRESEIRGRIERWMLRQRLAGNFASGLDGSGPRYGFDFGGAVSHPGGGGGGHGGGGHGGGGHGGGGGGHGS